MPWMGLLVIFDFRFRDVQILLIISLTCSIPRTPRTLKLKPCHKTQKPLLLQRLLFTGLWSKVPV